LLQLVCSSAETGTGSLSFSGHIERHKTAAIRRGRPPAAADTTSAAAARRHQGTGSGSMPTVIRRYRLHNRCSSKHMVIRGHHVNALAAPNDPHGQSPFSVFTLCSLFYV